MEPNPRAALTPVFLRRSEVPASQHARPGPLFGHPACPLVDTDKVRQADDLKNQTVGSYLADFWNLPGNKKSARIVAPEGGVKKGVRLQALILIWKAC